LPWHDTNEAGELLDLLESYGQSNISLEVLISRLIRLINRYPSLYAVFGHLIRNYQNGVLDAQGLYEAIYRICWEAGVL
jgi:uncharacterized protein YbgA (DUF1722 family)